MKAITVAALGGALLLTMAPAADSATSTFPWLQSSRITLTVKAQTASGTTTATRVLTCDPDGGTHPNPREACDLLRKVDGNIGNLREPSVTFCPAVYELHTVTAQGNWQGRREFYTVRTYSNRCRMLAATGVLFAFGNN